MLLALTSLSQALSASCSWASDAANHVNVEGEAWLLDDAGGGGGRPGAAGQTGSAGDGASEGGAAGAAALASLTASHAEAELRGSEELGGGRREAVERAFDALQQSRAGAHAAQQKVQALKEEAEGGGGGGRAQRWVVAQLQQQECTRAAAAAKQDIERGLSGGEAAGGGGEGIEEGGQEEEEEEEEEGEHAPTGAAGLQFDFLKHDLQRFKIADKGSSRGMRALLPSF